MFNEKASTDTVAPASLHHINRAVGKHVRWSLTGSWLACLLGRSAKPQGLIHGPTCVSPRSYPWREWTMSARFLLYTCPLKLSSLRAYGGRSCMYFTVITEGHGYNYNVYVVRSWTHFTLLSRSSCCGVRGAWRGGGGGEESWRGEIERRRG